MRNIEQLREQVVAADQNFKQFIEQHAKYSKRLRFQLRPLLGLQPGLRALPVLLRRLAGIAGEAQLHAGRRVEVR